MTALTEIFSKNLRRRRLELGMTQRELADKISYSEKAISKWESGVGLPPSAVLPELAAVLRISIDEMLRESDGVEYYLGLDCGGAKTEFALADRDGKLIGRVVRGATNSNDISYNEMQNTVYDGIFSILRDISPAKVSLYVGASGCSAADLYRLRTFLAGLGFCKVDVGSNVMVAMRLCLGEEDDGIVVNLGAGSVAFGRAGGKYYHCGGYGYMLGDACSGFELGRQAILSALKYSEGIGPHTLLYDYFTVGGEYGYTIDNHYDFYMHFYKEGKSSVAKYAPLIFKAVKAGDSVADKILREALSEVADMIRALAGQMNLGRVKVHLCGGLLRSAECILPILRSYLSEDSRHEYELLAHQGSLVGGALYYAGLDANCEIPVTNPKE